jgi:hypothetical protein
MSVVHGGKRKFRFSTWEAPALTTTFVVFFIIIPSIIAAGFGLVSFAQNSWTGTGKVVELGHIPASEGSFLNCGMIGVGGPCFFQDSSSPEAWYIKVRERNGADHTFNVTKEQFDSAKVGKQFTKQ